MQVKVKFTMEDLRTYEAEYRTDDIIEFASELTKKRREFPFIVGYEIEIIKEEI